MSVGFVVTVVVCSCLCGVLLHLDDVVVLHRCQFSLFLLFVLPSFVPVHCFSLLLLLVDEDSFEKDGPHSCVHCGFPQHSEKPWTKIPSLQVSLCVPAEKRVVTVTLHRNWRYM